MLINIEISLQNRLINLFIKQSIKVMDCFQDFVFLLNIYEKNKFNRKKSLVMFKEKYMN